MVGARRAFREVQADLSRSWARTSSLSAANGDGQTTKVANQIIGGLTIEGGGEALLFASKERAPIRLASVRRCGRICRLRIIEVQANAYLSSSISKPASRIAL